MAEAAGPVRPPDQHRLAAHVPPLVVLGALSRANVYQFYGRSALRRGWRPPGKARRRIFVGHEKFTRGGTHSKLGADRLPRQRHGDVHKLRLTVERIPLHPHLVQPVGPEQVRHEVSRPVISGRTRRAVEPGQVSRGLESPLTGQLLFQHLCKLLAIHCDAPSPPQAGIGTRGDCRSGSAPDDCTIRTGACFAESAPPPIAVPPLAA